jgi:hypothetical protein
MVERVEEMLAYVKAGMVKSLGMAAVFNDSVMYTANLHSAKNRGLELGAAILSLQHDYVCGFNDVEKPSLPEPQVLHEAIEPELPYRQWLTEPHNDTHQLANPEE